MVAFVNRCFNPLLPLGILTWILSLLWNFLKHFLSHRSSGFNCDIICILSLTGMVHWHILSLVLGKGTNGLFSISRLCYFLIFFLWSSPSIAVSILFARIKPFSVFYRKAGGVTFTYFLGSHIIDDISDRTARPLL